MGSRGATVGRVWLPGSRGEKLARGQWGAMTVRGARRSDRRGIAKTKGVFPEQKDAGGQLAIRLIVKPSPPPTIVAGYPPIRMTDATVESEPPSEDEPKTGDYGNLMHLRERTGATCTPNVNLEDVIW